jgi:hypothetical protein
LTSPKSFSTDEVDPFVVVVGTIPAANPPCTLTGSPDAWATVVAETETDVELVGSADTVTVS